MTITTDSVRRDLADLGADSGRAARSTEAISQAAHERRETVNRRLDELRPKSLSETAAADEYTKLIHERGQLDLVLARGN